MSRTCMVTGATPGFGHRISHSHRRTKRRFNVNVQTKRYWVPSLRRTVTLTVSARGIRTIDARGIDAVVRDILRRGVKV
ncbi:MAG: 50S ribosomal protein L28 [Dermatophilaceae bacterium]